MVPLPPPGLPRMRREWAQCCWLDDVCASSEKSAERSMEANVRDVGQRQFRSDVPIVRAGVMAFNMLAG